MANHLFKGLFQWWIRGKYLLSGSIILLSGYFFYGSLSTEFPDPLPSKNAGQFTITPMPLDTSPPYKHHEGYVKDFMLMFSRGDIQTIRQAYLSIGTAPVQIIKLEGSDEGLLHGSRHSQHAHAISPKVISQADKIWLIVQLWSGEEMAVEWDIPADFIR